MGCNPASSHIADDQLVDVAIRHCGDDDNGHGRHHTSQMQDTDVEQSNSHQQARRACAGAPQKRRLRSGERRRPQLKRRQQPQRPRQRSRGQQLSATAGMRSSGSVARHCSLSSLRRCRNNRILHHQDVMPPLWPNLTEGPLHARRHSVQSGKPRKTDPAVRQALTSAMHHLWNRRRRRQLRPLRRQQRKPPGGGLCSARRPWSGCGRGRRSRN